MPFPKIHIYNDLPQYPPRTLIEINGKKIPYVQSISYDVATDSLPEFKISMVGLPDIEIDNAVIRLDCCPENLGEAAVILINAIRTMPSLREAWISSIATCINECHEVTPTGMAGAIVDWLTDSSRQPSLTE